MSRNYLEFTENKNNPFMRDVFIDEVYKYAEKVITISEYDSSILGCHNINSKYLPYFPEKRKSLYFL